MSRGGVQSAECEESHSESEKVGLIGEDGTWLPIVSLQPSSNSDDASKHSCVAVETNRRRR